MFYLRKLYSFRTECSYVLYSIFTINNNYCPKVSVLSAFVLEKKCILFEVETELLQVIILFRLISGFTVLTFVLCTSSKTFIQCHINPESKF